MLHYGSILVEETSLGAQSYINAHKKGTKLMLDVYADRCQTGKFFVEHNKTNVRQFIHRKMMNNQEWFLTAKEAVCYGLADNIIGDKKYPNINSCLVY